MTIWIGEGDVEYATLGQHTALQLACSSTSSFANYGEVQSAEFAICLQEFDPLLRECNELLAIIATSIKTARRNGLPT